ncbi:hypothetical protein EV196_10883 [Mariniflexile fucanivorans]|uniref:Uncharacterized protein n=1 Tax=Mariniflexile fucanivorans TaxID=264023 RepID=A0A4V2QDI5_9FLAO|nr:hypothetical protein [Mariniflexile fucanivorans]TCL63887.1 hypothetical protein EV196_10883 [Mariniflexile fucanivorans]
MIIYPPKIIVNVNKCVLETVFETQGRQDVLWYKFPLEYKELLVLEQSDAALVGLLVLAMKNNEDIHIKGAISSKLYYTISSYLIRAIHISNPTYHLITIYPESLSEKVFNIRKIAATGISCGIDSFATIATHEEFEDAYQIKYFTYFNAGSHGVFGGAIANKIYEKGIAKAKAYAALNNIPLISIESNVVDVVGINFQKLHSLYHLSCVLTLQKIISVYYYSSAFRLDYYKLSDNDTSDWDIVLIRLLETESVNFYSSVSQFTRFERTALVSNYKPSYEFLDVCTAAQNSKKINCSKCEKCLRTQVSLELLGKLNEYGAVFDFEVYKIHKDQFISKLIFEKNKNQINLELYLKLKAANQIKLKQYLLNVLPFFCKRIYNLKKWFR